MLPRDSNERQEFFLRKATQVALRSDMAERHGCVIVNDNGDILASGYNHTSVHMCHSYSVHAEVDALRKLGNTRKSNKKKHVDLASAQMFVVRVGPETQYGHVLKLSKPCDSCRTQIQLCGVGKVFYSWSHIDYSVNKQLHTKYNH